MDCAIKPIAATTSLSLLIHGVAFAGLLLVYGQLTTLDEGVGRGVEIQLISSVLVSDQQEADVPRKQQEKPGVSSEPPIHAAQKKNPEKILTSPVSTQTVAETVDTDLDEQNSAEQQYDIQHGQLSADETESTANTAQATNASQQRHSMLELLHRRISDNKEYPYMARRQRREGVATVAFMLHPDGKIENTHLVTSSHAAALDRAALSAVKHIEPFTAAREYLEHAEEFKIDVVFNLL
jgi:protein TonB